MHSPGKAYCIHAVQIQHLWPPSELGPWHSCSAVTFVLSWCMCIRSHLRQGTAARLGAQVARLGRNQSLEDFAEQHGTYATCVLAVNFSGLPAIPILRGGQVLQLP